MVEQTSAPLDIDALITRIKAEAKKISPTVDAAETEVPGPAVSENSLTLKTVNTKGTYRVSDFLQLQGDGFLQSAYRGILQREPDADGLATYRPYLQRKGGRLLVLAMLMHSVEGRQWKVSVDGLNWLRSLPMSRALWPFFALAESRILKMDPRLACIPLLDDAMGRIEAELHRRDLQREDMERKIAEMERKAVEMGRKIDEMSEQGCALEARLVEVQDEARKSSREFSQLLEQRLVDSVRLERHFDHLRGDMAYHRLQLHEMLGGSRVRGAGNTGAEAVPEDSTDALLEAYYVAFEDAFRGDVADIRASFSHYLDDVQTAGAGSPQRPVLDVGCGRGEWLSLLQDAGLCAKGVDLNRVMVDYCTVRGLDAVAVDGLLYLKSLPDASQGAVSAFHLIEHLPFSTLYALVEHMHRVLAPGGVLIFETPNPENILVGSHTFYHDPTHRNPITPSSIAFLVHYLGFREPLIRRLHPYPEAARVPGNDALTERVNGHLTGPQDFALIAFKPG